MPDPGTSGIRSLPFFTSNGRCKIGLTQSCHSSQWRAFGHAHEMGRDLGVKMRRHGDAGRRRNRDRAQPAGYPADPHEIGHHAIAGFDLQCAMKRTRPVEVLTDLDGRLRFGSQPGKPLQIVIDDRLLDPCQPEPSIAWQRIKASARLRPWLKSTMSSTSRPPRL